MTVEVWTAFLDRLDAHLAGQQAAVARNDPGAIDALAPDEELGTLPPALLPRAIRLQTQCAALELLLRDALEQTALDLRRSAGPAHAATAVYIDSRA